MTLWPWSELRLLRRELNAARRSCSANAKKANRMAAHIAELDLAAVKRRGQIKHDQAYIDALEESLSGKKIAVARERVADLQKRHGPPVTPDTSTPTGSSTSSTTAPSASRTRSTTA